MRRRRAGVVLIAALLGLLLAVAPASAADGQGGGAPKPVGGGQKPKPEPEPKTPVEMLEAGIEARAWALIDARTGETLLSHAAKQRLPIASTTKLMTAYVALKELPLEKIVRAAPYEAELGESLLGLETGEKISVRDLLYGLIMLSGNDAAHTLAVAAAGSQERFVAQMNRRAAALGLADTHYANPIGLDQKGNYSTAADLLALSRRLLRMPVFAKIADAREAKLRSLDPPREIETINELVLAEPWATGVKTGHTWGARWILIGSGRRKGVELIAVSLGAPTDETRYSDNVELLEYGFSQYDRRRPIRSGEAMAEAEIAYAGGSLPLRAARTLKVGVREGQDLSVKVRAPAEVEGPIRRGARLGTATVFVDGLLAGEVPLEAGRAIPEASGFDRLREFLGDQWITIAIAACVILLGAILLYRRIKR